MKVTILSKSVNLLTNDTITSFLLEGFPYDVLQQIAKHRLFSISCESSRAIPLEVVINQILNDPFIPDFTLQQKGMSGQTVDEITQEEARHLHLTAAALMIEKSRQLSESGIHKQDCNALLKPWMKVNLIITTTHLENFYNLRLGSGTKGAFAEFANEMKKVDELFTPKPLEPGQWHKPYPELSLIENVAKCASISYSNHAKNRSPEDAKRLHDQLLNPFHATPYEHCAMAVAPGSILQGFTEEEVQVFDHFKPKEAAEINDAKYPQIGVGNFTGFLQYRKMIEGDFDLEKISRLGNKVTWSIDD